MTYLVVGVRRRRPGPVPAGTPLRAGAAHACGRVSGARDEASRRGLALWQARLTLRLRRVLRRRRRRYLHVLLLRRRLRVDGLLLRRRRLRVDGLLLLHVDGLLLHGALRVWCRGLAIEGFLVKGLSRVGLLVRVPTHLSKSAAPRRVAGGRLTPTANRPGAQHSRQALRSCGGAPPLCVCSCPAAAAAAAASSSSCCAGGCQCGGPGSGGRCQ